ncbi:MAG: 6,7-dimethyl-8-ribityllumazine synthase [Verrucomicrobiota bacterium]|nr:6,7-dimethyl-8-ribityllumazine synthase [Verrucomicrobiota bacterium]MEC9326756.1 6,7-dimethyl-8-ribityllumazine synthase [Verrucomicrobiota bacterium]MEE3176569.1 6,7-dimethyl-8-ribityllumazine synthase [Verrucomicrobiota bacterium]
MSSNSLAPKPRSIGTRRTISIVASLYNDELVNSLLNSTIEELRRIMPSITVPVYRVPGAFEIPVCAKHLIENNTNDALIALGVIIKGETDHADLIGSSVTTSLQNLALANNIPIIHEVLLTENREQAVERCQGAKNRGLEAAKAAITMAELFSSLNAIKDRRTSTSNG